ncbi:hypothetical protein [Psittacicella gerlachiana]|uniref:Uncharacterized protein n=1 Tax=Psittacicella gerlachiana TaxID=2028574 RepID=A0A3A1Y2A9_9GAMM|nr:hypothetical protein [Psittacicella gerlachiana]RIY31571.1 hypothetical protein CKF59_07560 [Psittacicella gerlachiana]
MKVVFTNHLQFLPQEEQRKLNNLFSKAWHEQYLLKIQEQLLELNIPFIDADLLLEGVDFAQIPFKKEDLYQATITKEDINRSKYFYKLYQILGQSHNSDWLETSFIDLTQSNKSNSVYLACATISKTKDSNLSQELLEQAILDRLSNLDLNTRKDEWILFLDKYAILHPKFFSKLKAFSKLRITPEILCLSEPSHEEYLTQQLLHLNENSSEAKSDLDELYCHTQTYLGKNNSLGDIVNIIFAQDYTPQYDYKKAYARYNKPTDSYFFVKRYDSSFATSAFFIRVSTMKKVGAIKPLHRLANDIFTLANGNTSPDIAFVRGSWALAPNLPANLLQLPSNTVVRLFSSKTRGLGCYIRQLRLTASLDTDNLQ